MAQQKQHVRTRVGEVAYVERGEGPAALFVHGVFLNSYYWRHVMARLAGERRCLAPDLLAHGDTPARPGQDVSLRAEAELLEAFCDVMGLDQVDVVANDSGSAIAQIFAARYPARIRTLTLTNGDADGNYPAADFRQVVEMAKGGVFSAQREAFAADVNLLRPGFAAGYERIDAVSNETLRVYLGPLFATSEATRALERWLIGFEDASQTHEIEPLLRQLTAPTLIVWGTGDHFFPVKWAYWLKGAIPGARQVVELEGAKLFFPEERPDGFADAVRAHWRASVNALAMAETL
jgi:pimeloyl-ACP methyl ester carboxylesterase